MADFIFPAPDEFDSNQTEEDETRLLRAYYRHQVGQLARGMIEESNSKVEVKQRRNVDTESRIIALRMPEQLLERLNRVASDAATNRSHFIRQLIADYLNSMEGRGMRFNGCLLSIDKF